MPERREVRSGRLASIAALALVGCSASPGPVAIVPDSGAGRRAIAAAMATWKAGRPPGAIEATSPRVQVVDTHRRPGQRLEGYEIVAESADARVRTFSLRLDLTGPDERPIARFLTVGIDPVLVFRQEDFDLLMHWEHRMDTEPGASPTPPSK